MKVPRGSTGSLEFNMTPMIDVTFLLIIFFITASHLSQQEVQFQLDLPTAATGRDPTENETPRVTVHVLPDGEVHLGSEKIGGDELSRRLRFEHEKQRRAGHDLEIRIRADRTVDYQVVEPVLLACAEAGVWKVSFAVVSAGR
jgi:biopolymer transport protein TolR